MKTLVTNDLHLTDRERDSYRFKLFPWLKEQCLRLGVKRVFILGDITDEKDFHSARLVNRIIKSIRSLTEERIEVYITMGNHDYIDPLNPFFKFANGLPGVLFMKEPCHISDGDAKVLCLPHTKDVSSWKTLKIETYDFIFIHQTVVGVRVENGSIMEHGVPASFFDKCKGKVFSGDIHVPQKIGKVEYIGAPYHIKFGDGFEPRVLFIDGDEHKYLNFPCIKKHSVVAKLPDDLLRNKKLRKGDQIKILVPLDRSELVDWETIKSNLSETCAKMGLVEYGILLERRVYKQQGRDQDGKQIGTGHRTTAEFYEAYCKKEGISGGLHKMGRKLLKKNA